MKQTILPITLLVPALLLSACAELAKHADAIKPTAKLVDTRLADINFEQADLEFDLAVENRNPIALSLAGLAYDFRIENHSLVSGVTAQTLSIKADSVSTVKVPVTLRFDDLKKLPGELWDKDRVAYQLDTQFNVMLPVIGSYPIPVTKTGEIPVPRVPKVRLKGVKLKNLSLTSAELVAQVEVDNPNGFDLGLSDFNYALNVNNQTWGNGSLSKASRIPGKGKGTVEIPLKLDLFSMGSGAYSMLSGGRALEYRLTGDVMLDTGIELLRHYRMPIDITGKTDVN